MSLTPDAEALEVATSKSAIFVESVALNLSVPAANWLITFPITSPVRCKSSPVA